jgi:hypothetical protein
MDRVRQWLKLDELLEKERQASLPWARSAEGQKSLGGGGGGGGGLVSLPSLLCPINLSQKGKKAHTVGGGGGGGGPPFPPPPPPHMCFFFPFQSKRGVGDRERQDRVESFVV